MVPEKTLDHIAQMIELFAKFVDQLEIDPTPRRAELTCLEARGVFGRLLPDWEEFLDHRPDSFDRLIEEHQRAAELMETPAENNPYARHALECTKARIEALLELKERRDMTAAVDAICRTPELAIF